jgi:hypothetical protein
MKRLKIFLIIFLFVFTFFAPKMVFAEGTCPCSCKDAGGAITSVGTLSETDCKAKCTIAVASCVVSATTTPTPTPAPTTPAPVTAVKAKICTAGCYCTSVGGAVLQKGDFTQQACISKCAETSGQRVAACAFSVEQTPDRSPYCFTKELCKKQNGVLDTDPLIGKKQALDCPAGLGYCFPNPKNVAKSELNVAIGDYKISADVNEYMNKLIDWMLGVGIAFVIIFVMVGGLQYTLGAASPAMVGKGKTLITRAITGLILLLCSWLVLNTVNPYLLKGQIPKFPMVKRVELVTSASCEDMEKDGYGTKTLKGDADVPKADKKCGTSATIAPKKDGTPVTGATTCDFKKCPSAEESCLGRGTTAKCLKCGSVVPGIPGISPSIDSCKQLTLKTTTKKVGGVDYPIVNKCFYTHDPTVILSAAEQAKFVGKTALASAATLGIAGPAATAYFGADLLKKIYNGACAQLTVDCSVIKSKSTPNDQCKEYDIAKAYSDSKGGDSSMENFFISDTWGDYNLQKLCVANPCGVAGGCMMDPDTLVKTDCISDTEGSKALKESKVTCPAACPAGQTCFMDGSSAVCATCEQMVKGVVIDGKTVGESGGLAINKSVCGLASSDDKNFCGYTIDSDANGPACARVVIDCSLVKAASESGACDAYDDMKVWNGKDGDDLDSFQDYGKDSSFSLKSICEKDPCGAGAIEGSACKFDQDSVGKDSCD